MAITSLSMRQRHRSGRAIAAALSLSALVLSLTATAGHAQIRLTGSTLYNATSNGTFSGGFWNTTPGDGGFNMYLFTGSPAAPTFLNSGDSAALVPNVTLALGDNVIGFATATSPSQFYGLNLYFDGANTTNRISAYVQDTASGGGFAQTLSGVSTYGLPSTTVPSANSLSYTNGALTVTLTGFTISGTGSSGRDLVSAFNNVPDGSNDNIGTLTLRVTSTGAAPEPGTLALLGTGALLPICGLIARRRRQR